MILDRKKAPDFKLNSTFEFLKAKKEFLENGIEFFQINNDSQRMVKLELVFDAGYAHHARSIIPIAASQLLFEGTKSRSSRVISESIEALGGFYDASCGSDSFSVTVYALAHHVAPILDIIKEVLYEATFPQKEINKYIQIQKQKFLVNTEKVSFLARNQFNELIFPADNPYYSSVKMEDFGWITRESILEFYTDFIVDNPFRLYVSGCVSAEIKKSIQDAFGKNKKKSIKRLIQIPSFNKIERQVQHVEKPGAVQSAIRIGLQTIAKNHEDYSKLFILNTILGGYFGSRLMTNIREEKGYTYGVGSGIASNKMSSTFFISTEVGAAYTELTIREIEKELNRLNSQLISTAELQLVKNYILGSLMRNFDGAFEAMDRFKAMNELGLNYSYYTNLFKTIKDTNSEELMELSKKYFNFEEMIEVVVGKIKN